MMKQKHLKARIEQCLAISDCSTCIRHKVGAVLLDPERNVVLMDGYNGGPRGAKGTLCGGNYCLRDGAPSDESKYHYSPEYETVGSSTGAIGLRMRPTGRYKVYVEVEGESTEIGFFEDDFWKNVIDRETKREERFRAIVKNHIIKNPPIETGTHYEIGCHHAEMNVITNAAARGVSCDGAWLILNQEPCILCAKLIHHAGIKKVICISGTFKIGARDYLEKNGVEVQVINPEL